MAASTVATIVETYLWQSATGQRLRTFADHTASVSSVAFSPDGRQLLTGSYDHKAILWDPATGKKLRTFAGHTLHVGPASGE